jgi:hypothetical protein
MSRYLIDIYHKSYSDQYSLYGKGIILINNDLIPTFTITTETGIVLYETQITSDFTYSIDKHCELVDTMMKLIFTVTFDSTHYQAKFDNNSSQACDSLVEQIDQFVKMNTSSIYYPNSRRVRMVGTFVDGKATGNGIEYYDDYNTLIKYKGEFENGKYDGSGIFYSRQKNISVQINNMCSGEANGLCTLKILNSTYGTIVYERTFKIEELEQEFDIKDNNFCYNIAKHFYPNINTILFRTLSVNDKLVVINSKINYLERTLHKMETTDNVVVRFINKVKGWFSR